MALILYGEKQHTAVFLCHEDHSPVSFTFNGNLCIVINTLPAGIVIGVGKRHRSAQIGDSNRHDRSNRNVTYRIIIK